MLPPMPSVIKVGPHTYTVVRRAMRKHHGWCDFDNLQIIIHKRIRRSKAQEVLLHEVIHACTYPTLNGKKQPDEEFVTGVAPVLLEALRANPEMVAYLTH